MRGPQVPKVEGVTALDHLLPGADESPKCTEFRRALDIDPAGTAISADRLLLVEAPLPWPKPVFGHHRLTAIHNALKESSVDAGAVTTRLLATVSSPAHEHIESNDKINVTVFDRLESGLAYRQRLYGAETEDDLSALTDALITGTDDSTWLRHDSTTVEPAILVCTQGSHDICCGSEGTRFAQAMEQRGEVAVYRVSHTGGHRFAPTALTLPGGRMWADLTVSSAEEIFGRAILPGSGAFEAAVGACRGWWGAATGPAQVAEREVLRLSGWDTDVAKRTVEVTAAPSSVKEQVDGQSTELSVSIEESTQWNIVVEQSRAVPTIACHQPGGLPAKPGREYRVVSAAQA